MVGKYSLKPDEGRKPPEFRPAPPAETRKDPAPPETKPPKTKRAEGGGPAPGRLVSLDAFRGFIMTMLAANAFGILAFTQIDRESPVWQNLDYEAWQQLAFHFDHPRWESKFGVMGVSFWDLIQPAFMFMVGVAMPFSYRRRASRGESTWVRHLHAALRAVILILLGVFLSSLSRPQTNWIFPNVLCQIGLGYLVAYALLGRKWYWQLTAASVILVGYWALFFFNPPPVDHDYAAVGVNPDAIIGKVPAGEGEVYQGRLAGWSKNANVAHFVDQRLLNWFPRPGEQLDPRGEDEQGRFVYNRGGYQTLNFVPSIATTLLGILCGQVMLCGWGIWKKIGLLILVGGICLGLALAAEPICPIVKRIWTPSWVLFSGAYVIWMLAGFSLLFDALPLKRLAFPLVVVGMNSILMYLMGQLIAGWTRQQVQIHFGLPIRALFGDAALDATMYGPLVLHSAQFLVFWLIAWWLYRQKYFFRI